MPVGLDSMVKQVEFGIVVDVVGVVVESIAVKLTCGIPKLSRESC